METNHDGFKKGWLPLTVYGVSFLRYLFEEYGMESPQGFLLVADDEQQARAFVDSYCKKTDGNGTKVELKKITKEKIGNFCVGFAVYHDDTQERVNKYLDMKEFFPVVISGGILPTEFRRGYYIFRITDMDMNYLKCGQFAKDVAELKKYVVRNVQQICHVLCNVEKSLDYRRKNEVSDRELFRTFLSFAEIYRRMLQDNYGEECSEQFRKWYISASVRKIEAIADFADGHDIQDIVFVSVWKNIKNGTLKTVRHMEDGNEEVLLLYKNSKALFYDEQCYYFNENHLRTMCLSTLDCFSWHEFKVMLADEDIIERFSTGFTTKRTVKCDDNSQRIRCIIMRKEMLNSKEDGLLEDYIQSLEQEANIDE